MKLRSPSLFIRLLLLVVLAVLLTQAITLTMASAERHRLIGEQVYTEVLDALASAEAALDGLGADEREDYLAAQNQPGFPHLVPANADIGLAFRQEQTPLMQTLETRLSATLGERVTLRMRAVDGKRELWFAVHILGEAYWLVVPAGRFGERLISTTLLASLLASLAAVGLAFLFAWQLSQPLARLSAAVREREAGRTPGPVPVRGVREIRTLAESFNQMNQSLDNAERERRLMLAGLSHDLRTPLTRLKLLLEMQDDNQDRQDMLDDVDELSRIVTQFCDFARAAEVKQAEAVALSDLAASVASRFARNGLQVDTRLQPGVEVLADALGLERLLGNLLENARRYGKAPVVLSLETTPTDASLTVTDHGPGIPPALREAALAPFERLAAHRGTDGGSGLGLAIVSRVVRQHHGTLAFVDEADGGFSVVIRLPRPAAS